MQDGLPYFVTLNYKCYRLEEAVIVVNITFHFATLYSGTVRPSEPSRLK